MQPFFQFNNLSRCPKISHGITKKNSGAAYDYSMALHTGEAPEDIVGNRYDAAAIVGCDDGWRYVLADQTHSDHIAIVHTTQSRGWNKKESAITDTDALVTDQKRVILGILSADCVPVLLYDPRCEIVAAIHAGWKGSAERIVAKCVTTMHQIFGTDPADIIAGIAPSIGSCCYKVGGEVAVHFTNYEEALTPKGEEYMLDLPEVNRLQLIEEGVLDSQIELSGICTACHEDDFFSYRKTQGCSGRFMSMIGMKEI